MSKTNLLNYRVSGAGHPVVFLHGFLESNTMWEQLLPYLSNVKAYCIELPGHGTSLSFNGILTIEHLAHEVLAVLKKEGVSSASIVGHSLGGYVALALLKINTNVSFDRLILLNSHPWEDSPIKKNERTQVAKIVQKNKRLFIKQAIPNLFQQPTEHKQMVEELIQEALLIKITDITAMTIAMRNRPSAEKTIKKYSHKTTIIQGEYDRLIPVNKMTAFCEQNDIQLIIVRNAGHMAHIEQTEQVIKSLNNSIN